MLGLMVLYALTNLPSLVGMAFWCWITFMGLGGLVLSMLSHRKGFVADAGVPPPPPEIHGPR